MGWRRTGPRLDWGWLGVAFWMSAGCQPNPFDGDELAGTSSGAEVSGSGAPELAPTDCDEVTSVGTLDFGVEVSGPIVARGIFLGPVTVDGLGDPDMEDELVLEMFPEPSGDVLFRGGEWSLDETRPWRCDPCLSLFVDGGRYRHARAFFQHSGRMRIEDEGLAYGRLRGELQDVVLVEYDLDTTDGETGRIDGGRCLTLDARIWGR